MKKLIREQSVLYKSVQWGFFPAMLIATPYVIYELINKGGSVAITTYVVAVAVGLVFWLAEWLMPFKEKWNYFYR